MGRIFSSDGCADAMCAAAVQDEEANYIDNSLIEQLEEALAIERDVRTSMEATEKSLKLAAQSALLALNVIRLGYARHFSSNMLKDMDFAIEACRGALDAQGCETADRPTSGDTHG